MMSHEVGDIKNIGKSFPESTWSSTVMLKGCCGNLSESSHDFYKVIY